ncbi:PREDICTED: uncharacterized protein LOC104753874 [Camelina sativa]|uniref:Uncharacterized protein LOC104753874 n=1 Tax=Camelina sativa TaxID=90675 RepID=A0ABM0WPT8_CAMSA|nr:PREDICTED: uncharacterized protein LOC104753874 [Camelina sativa]
MERQVMASRIVQRKEDYLPSKQVSDESSEELEKSCLTEEEEDQDACLSDASHNIKKRMREATTTCESMKRKKRMPSKDSGYQTLFHDDDWLFGNTDLPKNVTNNNAAIKNDQDMIMKMLLQIPLSGDSLFPRAQFLPQVKIFALPYTVPY